MPVKRVKRFTRDDSMAIRSMHHNGWSAAVYASVVGCAAVGTESTYTSVVKLLF
jgi:hypothetical protein